MLTLGPFIPTRYTTNLTVSAPLNFSIDPGVEGSHQQTPMSVHSSTHLQPATQLLPWELLSLAILNSFNDPLYTCNTRTTLSQRIAEGGRGRGRGWGGGIN